MVAEYLVVKSHIFLLLGYIAVVAGADIIPSGVVIAIDTGEVNRLMLDNPTNEKISDEAKGEGFAELKGQPVHLPSGAPNYLVAIVHGLSIDDGRLVVTHLPTGAVTLLPEVDGIPYDPVWAPNGLGILFRVGDQLFFFNGRQKRLDRLADDLSFSFGARGKSYAFSSDGRWVAFARHNAIQIFSIDEFGTFSRRNQVSLPDGAHFSQLLWAVDNHHLVILVNSSDGLQNQLVWLDLPAQKAWTQEADKVIGLLGWDSPTGGLVVIYSDPERIGDEAAIFQSSGEIQKLRIAEEDEAGELVVAYRSMQHEVVAILCTEDLGDPMQLGVLPPGAAPARPWLQNFTRLAELSLSANGNWATFVDQSPLESTGESCGHIYIVPFGSEDAIRVLEAIPNSYCFSTPVFRP